MAPLLGVAWSPAAGELRDLSYFVDIVEAPGWMLNDEGVLRQSRVLLHNLDHDVTLADLVAFGGDWERRAGEALSRTGTPWFSMHLGFSAERVRFDQSKGHMLPESPTLERSDLLDRMAHSAREAASVLTVPLLLENLDYCPGGAYEHVCEPEFIDALLSATDCGMLLDLAHAQVTASWLGIPVEELLDRMPLERVVEVHVSSPRESDTHAGRLYDAHEPVTERDLDLLRLVLSRSSPRMVVLEFRRDAEQLRAQLLQLGRILKRRPRPRPC